jgi:tetratricopeptide (TPR) repeat protein
MAGRVRSLASTAADNDASKRLATDGWDRYTKGDLEGAEPLLAKAAAVPGSAAWVSYALGFAQVGLKHPQAATQSWERVRAEAPQFTPVYLDLADIYVQAGDPERAIATLRAAEQRWPADIDVLNALGTVQVSRGAHADAVATFQKAISAKPDDSLAYFNLARTYELRYYGLRRFSRPNARWIDNPELLTKARENYEAYVKLGGPYLNEAQAALKRIWSR